MSAPAAVGSKPQLPIWDPIYGKKVETYTQDGLNNRNSKLYTEHGITIVDIGTTKTYNGYFLVAVVVDPIKVNGFKGHGATRIDPPLIFSQKEKPSNYVLHFKQGEKYLSYEPDGRTLTMRFAAVVNDEKGETKTINLTVKVRPEPSPDEKSQQSSAIIALPEGKTPECGIPIGNKNGILTIPTGGCWTI